MADPILDVLAQRYITAPIRNIYSDRAKNLRERELWLSVLRAQRELGLDVPQSEIEKFEATKNSIDLVRIEEIEKGEYDADGELITPGTKHDVKAKIQAFVEVADAEQLIHRGMTSRDLTDNVELWQMRDATAILFGKYVAVLNQFVQKAEEYSQLVIPGRSHHQMAQPTTIGKRFSTIAEELYHSLEQWENLIVPFRGIKGPVGNQSDMAALLGSEDKALELERIVAEELGFGTTLSSTGQVYPRSIDHSVIYNMANASKALRNFAITVRLMAGESLVTEGFLPGQVGSTAMPHKKNTSKSERVYGFSNLIAMYEFGAGMIAGDQWEEGDVSCSVVRRVIIPQSIYATDGMLETTLTILENFGAYESMANDQIETFGQFLASTRLLTAAMHEGIGREDAHKLIKDESVALASERNETGGMSSTLAYQLSQKEEFSSRGLTEDKLTEIINGAARDVGRVEGQIADTAELVTPMIDRHSEWRDYKPEPIP